MRRLSLLGGLVAAGAFAVAVADAREPAPLTVQSSAFSDGGAIPRENTCDGTGAPPPLSWSALPPGTRSVAVVVEDTDAPGGTYAHFAAFNLPPTQSSLPTAAIAAVGQPGSAVASARNSAGTSGFAPICPPSGRHRYRFIVTALDAPLAVPRNAPVSAVENAMEGHVLARGVLVGTYQRSR
jgi:Raf kinase inhibitor-like YbhB/YbcL family protein